MGAPAAINMRDVGRVPAERPVSVSGRHHSTRHRTRTVGTKDATGALVQRFRPEKRLAQHLNDVHASRVVKKRGICLLPSLYAHLNPLQRANAQELEPKLKEIFIAVGIPERLIKGGH
jgi:hypothetical protein